ncbi:hypothetical protein C8F04DRAFT_1008707 [Mycena alexandri]|uniref:F-box domain-containing protein n=1 Tax=Mycena alexandri TaxID=1745969 RepID=A0AAD6SHF6_9AGAR|nr:hypothetical protein C8F04DRAFT_1008707 [Mycena alexandri]
MSTSADISFDSICKCPPFQVSHLFADEPRILEMLRANNAPANNSELAHFRGLVDEGRLELARYDAEVGRIEIILDELLLQRGSLARHVDRYKSVVAPVRRLPPELLIEIFGLCGHPCAADLNLLPLSQVCSYWRRIAVGTPILWSHIDLDVALWRRSGLTSKTLLGRLDSSLQRGGSLPLTLQVDLQRDDPYDISIVKTLVKHSARWRYLSFSGELESLGFLTSVNVDLPLLESLSISDVGEFEVVLNFFERAAGLRDFTFEGDVSRIPTIHWEHLQSFQYRDIGGVLDLSGPLSLMCRLSAGAKFCAVLDTSSTDILFPDSPQIVSNVGSFSLALHIQPFHDHITGVLREIFGAITLPRVQHLTLHHQWYTPAPTWNQASFFDFASRSSLHTNLIQLDLRIIISEDELLQCLVVLPLLQHLTIADSEHHGNPSLVTDHLLRRLAWISDENCLIPRLHSFTCTSLRTFTDEALLEFLTSRLVPRPRSEDGGTPFHATVWRLFTYSREFSPWFHGRVHELVKRGDLVFKDGLDPSQLVDPTLWNSGSPVPVSLHSRSPSTASSEIVRRALSTVTERTEEEDIW